MRERIGVRERLEPSIVGLCLFDGVGLLDRVDVPAFVSGRAGADEAVDSAIAYVVFLPRSLSHHERLRGGPGCPTISSASLFDLKKPPCTGTVPAADTLPVSPEMRTKLATVPPIWKNGMLPNTVQMFFLV